MAVRLSNGNVLCEQCNTEYERIGTHWGAGDCSFPSLSDYQTDIITGLLMGDGYINRRDKNPWLHVNMTNERYLQELDGIFGPVSSGVSLSKSAEQSASDSRKYGVDSSASEENYSNLYTWYTIHHPDLKQFSEWYSSGKKVWPENITLTPTVLKHWYVCDGNWHNTRSHNYMRISMSNEAGNWEKVNSYFSDAGLPTPSNYDTYSDVVNAEFTVEESKQLWRYMGEPPPGFEHKWPDQQI